MSTGSGRKRAHPPLARETPWLRESEYFQRKSIYDDDSGNETDNENVSLAWRSGKQLAPQVNATSQPVLAPARKRRHVDHELRGGLSNMRIDDMKLLPSSEVNDLEMGDGNSYEISPNRVYVHTLDDSDDEERVKPRRVPHWEINSAVAKQLEAEARHKEITSVPKWIAESKPNKQLEQALVLWRPSPWAATVDSSTSPEQSNQRPFEAETQKGKQINGQEADGMEYEQLYLPTQPVADWMNEEVMEL